MGGMDAPEPATPFDDLRDRLRRVQADLVYEASVLDEGDTCYLSQPAVHLVRMSIQLDDAVWELDKIRRRIPPPPTCPCCGGRVDAYRCPPCAATCGDGIHIAGD